jgi:hypothetical protein
MYLKRSNKLRFLQILLQWKTINIKNSVRVSVALGTQLATRLDHTAIYGLPRSTVFFHTISQTSRFSKIEY